MINLSKNMSIITPKGLAKKTFKGAGKAMISDFKPKISRKSMHSDLMTQKSK